MWEVLAFFRVVAVFTAFFVLLPSWARGTRAGEGPAGRVATFVRFCFFVEVAVVLLGVMGLALPGALLAVCFVWLALDLVQREPDLLAGRDYRRAWFIDLLIRLRRTSPATVTGAVKSCRRPSAFAAPVVPLVAAALVARAIFPVLSARFVDLDDYSRALSLAVLSNGHQWIPDFSVPLVLPLQYLSAVSAPRAVALSAPIFSAALVAAVGFAVFQLRGCRLSSAGAMGVAALLMVSPLLTGATARAELSVLFILLAIGLQASFRTDALLSLILGVAMGLTPAHAAASAEVLVPYAGCLLLGVGLADFRLQPPPTARMFAGVGIVACLVVGSTLLLRRSLPDGPVQYEEASRIALRLAAEQPRNSWALVATTQELPYVYGSGWHVELAAFVNDTSVGQVAHPSYRFPYPVKDVYFLVEAEPLTPYDTVGTRTPLQVRLSPTPSAAYVTPLERASLEFQLAELLSVYRQSHDDLEVVHQSEKLMLLRAPGSLRDER